MKRRSFFFTYKDSRHPILNRLIEWEYNLFEMPSVDPVLFRWSAAHLRELSQRRLQKTRMFKGHMVFGLHEVLPQPATYITVLRDPVDRVISAFYFMRTYKLHPLYWRLEFGNWSLEDFVRRSRKRERPIKILAGASMRNLARRRSVKERRRTCSAILVLLACPSVSKKASRR